MWWLNEQTIGNLAEAVLALLAWNIAERETSWRGYVATRDCCSAVRAVEVGGEAGRYNNCQGRWMRKRQGSSVADVQTRRLMAWGSLSKHFEALGLDGLDCQLLGLEEPSL
jgi:hypothetical protein